MMKHKRYSKSDMLTRKVDYHEVIFYFESTEGKVKRMEEKNVQKIYFYLLVDSLIEMNGRKFMFVLFDF